MMNLKIFFFLIFGTFALVHGSNPTVEISDGTVEGLWNTTTAGNTFASFRGIPYANPPTGDNRFADPVTLDKWSGVWDATSYGARCAQYNVFTKSYDGSEDCLFVNVFTRNINSSASLPVVVFIHGGGYLYGSSSEYDCDRLMDYDLVVVSMNYRLGPLGFLSTADDVASGNFGLKDQSFALKWVQNNIKMFGGNPDDVTLIGQSAGAVSAVYHYLSPLSNGTFHKGFAYSGSPLNPWAFTKKPLQKTETLAGLVGCSTTTTEVMISCLRNASAEDLALAQLDMIGWDVALFGTFVPCAESSAVSNPFLADTPLNIIKSSATKLPLVLTTTSDEGLYPTAALQAYPTLFTTLNANWTELAPIVLAFNDTLSEDLFADVATQIKEKYFGDDSISQENFTPLVEMFSNRLFQVGIGELAKLYAEYSGQTVYLGEYTLEGNYSLTNVLAGNTVEYGSCHGDDFLHIFKAFGLDSNSTIDEAMNEQELQILYSYITTNVPTMSDGTTWTAVTAGSSDISYMQIDSATSYAVKTTTDFASASFWENLGFDEDTY